jgi:uncharacterized protein YbbC (DUF1343 family)
MIEASRNYSVGRGTDAPFEQVGAEWIHGRTLADYLNRRIIPGVRVYPTRFRPASSIAKDKLIEGVRFVITDREAVDAVRLGVEIAAALEKLWPGKIDFERCRYLIGSRTVIEAIKSGEDPRSIIQKMEEPLQAWVQRRRPYLLY